MRIGQFSWQESGLVGFHGRSQLVVCCSVYVST